MRPTGSFTVHWDIVHALYLIHKQPREPQPIDVAMFARNYGFFFVLTFRLK